MPRENWETFDGVLRVCRPGQAGWRRDRHYSDLRLRHAQLYQGGNHRIRDCLRKAKLEAASGVKNPYLVSLVWVAKIYEKYGPEPAMYVSRIEARFATAGPDALIPLAWIERAQARWQDDTDKLPKGLTPSAAQEKVLGVDVAEFGSDSTVRPWRIDRYLAWQRVSSHEDSMVAAGRVATDLRTDAAIHANVDAVGIGDSVARRLEELFGDRASGINVGERPRSRPASSIRRQSSTGSCGPSSSRTGS